MSLLAALAIGGKVVSGISKLRGARRQDDAAEEGQKIAYENAANTRLENAETERRAARSIAQVEGENRARAAAGGTKQNNANTTSVADALVSENKKQFSWLQVSGETRAKAIERGADYQRQIGEAQADASRWGAVSDFAGAVGAASYTGVFDSWGGKNPVGSQYSWMNATSVGKPDPLALTNQNFNIFGGQ